MLLKLLNQRFSLAAIFFLNKNLQVMLVLNNLTKLSLVFLFGMTLVSNFLLILWFNQINDKFC